ncbi:MAG: TlpA disulfide reductase family protein [Bacillota bacterium]
MKSKFKVLALIAIIVVVLIGGGFAYDQLSNRYSTPGEPSTSAQPTPVIAPDFTVKDAEGNSVSLSDFQGKPVVINFWASWCGYCTDEMPLFQEIYKDYGEQAAFMMINLTDGSRETLKSAKSFIEDKGYTFPVYFDTELEAAYAYNTYSIPVTYFIDANGNIAASIQGIATKSKLLNKIETILQ